MSKRRKALPPPPSGVDPQTRQWMESVQEQLEVSQGVRGSSLDQFVAFGDILDIGLAQFRSAAKARFGATDLIPSNQVTNRAIPPRPEGVQGVSVIGANTIIWSDPNAQYVNHSLAEVWRSEGTGSLLGSAAKVGTAKGTIYSDYTAAEGVVYVYWVRFVSDGSINGPFHASAGLELATVRSATSILDSLNEEFANTSASAGYLQKDFIIDAARFAIRTGDPGDTRIPFAVVPDGSGGDVVVMQNVFIDQAIIGPISTGKLFLPDGTPITTVSGLIAADTIDVTNLYVDWANITNASIDYAVITGTKPAANADNTQSAVNNTIVMSGGAIRAGKTSANDTGTAGYYLGFDGSIPEFIVGNSSNYLRWNGSSLVVRGNVQATSVTANAVNTAALQSNVVNTDKLVTGAVQVNGTATMSRGSPGYDYYTVTGVDSLGYITGGSKMVCYPDVSGAGEATVTLDVRFYNGAWSSYSVLLSASGFNASAGDVTRLLNLPAGTSQIQFRFLSSGGGFASANCDFMVFKR